MYLVIDPLLKKAFDPGVTSYLLRNLYSSLEISCAKVLITTIVHMQLNSKRLLKQNFHIFLEVTVFLNIVSQKENKQQNKKKYSNSDCNVLI